MIELVHLEKRYGNAVPLADVNAVINDGDVISIIGPSGTGKSTLIRCIDMLERPTGGKIILNGEDICAPGYDVTKARRKMGMVFQSFNLFGHLNVIENIMQAQIDILKKPKNEAYETGMKLLRRVGLANKETNYPDDGDIVKVDDTHYILHLRHATTLCFKGATTLRFVIYNENGTLVVSGENAMPMLWDEEPATKNLKL